MSLSVCIITRNEESNLERTLSSIRDIATEIVIVDSGSTDKTKEIALSFNASFFSEEWKGFVRQKNSALEKCTQKWILCIDADEVPDDELKKQISEAIDNDSPFSYKINIRSFYLSKLLNHTWQPEWKLRLVRSDASPEWSGGDVHESLNVNNEIKKIKGFLIHYSYRDLEHHIEKLKSYSLLTAKSMKREGKKFHYFNLYINPVINFIKMYIVHLGFMDGKRGLTASRISAYGTYLKYKYLKDLWK